MPLQPQAVWLLCFITGIWLGARSGWMSDAEAAASGQDRHASGMNTERSHGVTSGGPASSPPPVSSPTNAGPPKPAASVKKASLDDLRRLLALDPYECDLRRMFSDFESLAGGLPSADLPAAAAILWGAPHRIWSVMPLVEVLRRWAENDPKAPLGWLRGLEGDDKIVRILRQNVLSVIGRKDAALLWQEIGPTQEWMQADWRASGTIGQAFARDLKLAQKFLDAASDPGVRYFALSSIADELANTDPAAAVSWLRSQPRSDWCDDIISSMYGRLADKNPDAAIAALNDASAGLRTQDRERILDNLAEHHPARVQAIIAAGGLKKATMRMAGLIGSSTHASSAASMLELAPEVPAGEVRDAFLGAISSGLSRSGDLDRAWQAIRGISPSLERDSALRSYGQARAAKSIAEATTWLSGLPMGADRDAAISGFAQAAIDKQPQTALEWAGAVTDAVYRAAAVESHFETWYEADARAAKAWLDTATTLSADEKTRLMQKVAEN